MGDIEAPKSNQADPESWPRGSEDFDWHTKLGPHIDFYVEGLQLSQVRVVEALDQLALLYPPDVAAALHEKFPDRRLLAASIRWSS